MIGLAGCALFYGDGVITPAVTVLGALEGLAIAAPVLGASDRSRNPGGSSVAFQAAAPRHRGNRLVVRTVHVGLVRDRERSARFIAMHPNVSAAANPVYAVEFFAASIPASRFW